MHIAYDQNKCHGYIISNPLLTKIDLTVKRWIKATITLFCEQYFFCCFRDHMSDECLMNLSMSIKQTFWHIFLILF